MSMLQLSTSCVTLKTDNCSQPKHVPPWDLHFHARIRPSQMHVQTKHTCTARMGLFCLLKIYAKLNKDLPFSSSYACNYNIDYGKYEHLKVSCVPVCTQQRINFRLPQMARATCLKRVKYNMMYSMGKLPLLHQGVVDEWSGVIGVTWYQLENRCRKCRTMKGKTIYPIV